MSISFAVLIVGIDSLIGRNLKRFLIDSGITVYGTTRRKNSISEHCIFLDLTSENLEIEIPKGVSVVIYCAAVSGYSGCNEGHISYLINVKNTNKLVSWFLRNEIFTIFLSTNAVFSGKYNQVSENEIPDGVTQYGMQKAEAEKLITTFAAQINGSHLLAILRLTKVVSWDSPTFRVWRSNWREGVSIKPFRDLKFSPITLDYLSIFIMKLIQLRYGGIFHLSGEVGISYSNFAKILASTCGLSHEVVSSITASEAEVTLHNSPDYPAMSMENTSSVFGIKPQKLEDAIKSMANQWIAERGLKDF